MKTKKAADRLRGLVNTKDRKRSKGYYLPQSYINLVKAEAERLSTPENKVSENEVLIAIIDFYAESS